MSKRKLSQEQIDEIKRRYIAGETTYELAEDYPVYRKTISKYIKQEGVKIRSNSESHRKLSLNQTAFKQLDPETEYWIGFLMGDGSVYWESNNSASIDIVLHEKDREHLIKFRDFLNSEHSISKVKDNYVRFSIKSTKLANQLERWDVVPNKTKITKAVFPLDESKHFWRGCIDADGCIGVYNYLHLSLHGSKKLLEQFNKYITERFKNNSSVNLGNGCYKIVFGGLYVKDILKFLYQDEQPYLDRKKKIVDQIISNA